MMLAQRLYEGVELGKEGAVGLITYMRTDSTRVSERRAQGSARLDRRSASATQYLPANAEYLQGKKDAQDAHEAIRPTSVLTRPSRWRSFSPKTS